MAFSYPKQTHVTLPSVESWGINNSILRDPPKSLYTRKIDKVGQNNDLIDIMDESGSRACEFISLYPRGTNPFVSVSYSNDNAGLNGSYLSGGLSGGKQAYLPYRVGESFRPPVLGPRDLLPLSRLPRLQTSVQPTISFSIQNTVNDKKYEKEVKENVLQATSSTNWCSSIEPPTDINRNVPSYVKDTNGIHYAVNTNMSAPDNSCLNNPSPSQLTQINNHTPYFAVTNKYDPSVYVSADTNFATIENYTHDHNYYNANTNLTSFTKEGDSNYNRNLDRNLPIHHTSTNIVDISTYNNEVMGKEKSIKPKISAGGMDGRGTLPTNNRVERVDANIGGNNIKRKAFNQYMERSMAPPPAFQAQNGPRRSSTVY